MSTLVHASLPARRAGRRFMLLAAACFVANVLLIRAFGRGAGDVWVIAALRFGAGLGLCLAYQRGRLDIQALATRPRLIMRGLVGAGGTYGLYVTIIELGAGRAVFLNNLYVLFSALLAVGLLGERFRWPLALGAIFALLGLGWLTGGLAGELRLGFYDFVALGVALASAWIVVAIRQLHAEGVATPTIFAAQCLYGLLLCAPFLVFGPITLGGTGFAGLLAAGLCAGVGQLAMTHAYRTLAVGEGTLLQTLVPLGAAAGGIAFFGESLGWADVLGGVLIVGGSMLPLVFAPTETRRS